MSKLVLIVSLFVCQALVASLNNNFVFPDELASLLNNRTTSNNNGNKHNSFDWELLKAELTSKKDNVVISPYTVKLLLSLLSQGSAENSKTHKQLSKVLPGLERQFEQFDYIKKTLDSLLEKSQYHKLNIASQIFVDNSISLKENYKKLARELYDSPSTNLDFNNIKNALQTVNNWVSKQTNGHIKELVEEDDLKDAVAILLNAIYFKGTWKLPFDESSTKNKPFYVNPSTKINVPTMSNEGKYYYGRSSELNSKIVRLPYVGDKYALYVMLPNDKDGLNNLLNNITPRKVEQLQAELKEEDISLDLPKFKFDYKAELKDTLEKLGINDIFEDSANFDNLSSTPLKVKNIVQKAGIIVDEKGTTAYAATDVEFGFKMSVERFVVNHPFLFFVQDEKTGSILFAGKIIVPKF